MKLATCCLAFGLAMFTVGCGKKTDDKADDKTASVGKTGGSSPDGNVKLPSPLTATQRMEVMNNLKQIMLSTHTVHEIHGAFPRIAGDSLGKGKGKGLSWRVHILPYLELNHIYQQFRLDEPWDSPHNKSLLKEMPDVYKTPGGTDDGKTVVRAFSGVGTSLGNPKVIRFSSVIDGMSNTAAVIVAGPENAIEWTKPQGLTFSSSSTPTAILGKIAEKGYLVGMMDTEIVTIDAALSLADLQRLFHIADGAPDHKIFVR